jgi:hypothetical protein
MGTSFYLVIVHHSPLLYTDDKVTYSRACMGHYQTLEEIFSCLSACLRKLQLFKTEILILSRPGRLFIHFSTALARPRENWSHHHWGRHQTIHRAELIMKKSLASGWVQGTSEIKPLSILLQVAVLVHSEQTSFFILLFSSMHMVGISHAQQSLEAQPILPLWKKI